MQIDRNCEAFLFFIFIFHLAVLRCFDCFKQKSFQVFFVQVGLYRVQNFDIFPAKERFCFFVLVLLQYYSCNSKSSIIFEKWFKSKEFLARVNS